MLKGPFLLCRRETPAPAARPVCLSVSLCQSKMLSCPFSHLSRFVSFSTLLPILRLPPSPPSLSPLSTQELSKCLKTRVCRNGRTRTAAWKRCICHLTSYFFLHFFQKWNLGRDDNAVLHHQEDDGCPFLSEVIQLQHSRRRIQSKSYRRRRRPSTFASLALFPPDGIPHRQRRHPQTACRKEKKRERERGAERRAQMDRGKEISPASISSAVFES